MKKLFRLTLLIILPLKPYAENFAPAQIILIGEQHGKAQQIHMATEIIQKYAHKQNNIAIALEHIPQKYQNKLQNWTQIYENPDKLAIDIEWWKSGWPNWMVYRPLFQAAYDLNIPLIATDNTKALPLKQLQKIWGNNYSPTYKAWSLIIKDYHQNNIQNEKLNKLIILQMSRDIHMANNIKKYLQKNPHKKIIYLAGQDHIRNNYSVKSLLKEYSSVSIALNCPKLNHKFDQHTQKCM